MVGGPVAETFNIIKAVLNPEVVKATQGVYKFDLSGKAFLSIILPLFFYTIGIVLTAATNLHTYQGDYK